jgi:hypothetical protein
MEILSIEVIDQKEARQQGSSAAGMRHKEIAKYKLYL